jgi:hypothetical protein
MSFGFGKKAAILCLLSLALLCSCSQVDPDHHVEVLLVYNIIQPNESNYVLDAYKSVLEEEGVPYRAVVPSVLLSKDPSEAALYKPAVILVDGMARTLPHDIVFWLKRYLKAGGNVALIYDAGCRDLKNSFLPSPLLEEIVGINYAAYDMLGDSLYTSGAIEFTSESNRKYFQIPPGKMDSSFLLTGYSYGELNYPFARALVTGADISQENIYAFGRTSEGKKYPVLILRDYLEGRVLYANLPLGHLKSYSDDLLLRAVLRTFLFKEVKIPHLVNTPGGKGGLIINWHIDANPDWQYIPMMINKRYLRRGLEYSIHITAGDYRDWPGDELGFDACGKGKELVEKLAEHGTVGSHGGWAHNLFYDSIVAGAFGQVEIKKYIKLNNDCLTDVIGYNITEYSAPGGAHPQPVTTEIIEKMGINSYYYTGDAGSAPNLTFSGGKKVSETVYAFPVMPLGAAASFGEMSLLEFPEEKVQNWLLSLVDYININRTIRLMYSHPYDIPGYPKALAAFLDYADSLKLSGAITIKPMGHYSRFLRRFSKTEYFFSRENKELNINLSNPNGLNDITLALPKKGYVKPSFDNVDITEDEFYYYLVVGDSTDVRNLRLTAD